MANLFHKVKLYLEANEKTDKEIGHDMSGANVCLVNDSDGRGDYIKVWNVSGLTQPTEEQLNAFESQANDLEALYQVYANRKAEYPSIEELVVALYDTEDKLAIETKRAAIKLKYPKS